MPGAGAERSKSPKCRSRDRGERTGALAPVALLTALALAIVPVLVSQMRAATLAQDDEDRVDAGQALLRIVQAAPDTGPVDVLIDDGPVLTAVEFGTVSDYLPLSDGKHSVKIVAPGGSTDQAMIDQDVDLEDGVPYVFAILGLLDDLESRQYTVDRNRIEDPNAARVRVIHLSPDAGSVDVVAAGGDAWFEDVGYTDAAEYIDVAAGTYDLEMRSHDGDGVVSLTSPGITLDPGKIYDLLAIGQAADDSLQLLNAATTALMGCVAVFGLDGAPDDACARFVHASPVAPNVDVYVDEGERLAVVDLGVGGATPVWIVLPAGEHRVDLVPTGEPIEDAIGDGEIELEAGSAYDIIALDILDDTAVASYELDLTPLGDGQARLRAVDVVPDADEVAVAVAGGPVLFDGLVFGRASEPLEIQAGPMTLELRDGDGEILHIEPNLSFEAGIVYHLYATGRIEDRSLRLLVLPARPAEDAIDEPPES